MAETYQDTCWETLDVHCIEQGNKPSAPDSCINTEGTSRYQMSLDRPYLELGDISTNEIFDHESILQSMNDYLPPPSKFSRNRLCSSSPLEASGFHGAVISLLKPHKILAVSDELLNTVAFEFDQILGRSIQVLVGPKTDMIELSAAIKNTGHMQVAQINTVLYTSCGRELDVTAMLSPYVNVMSGSLGGCVLRIDCIRDGAGTSSPAFLLEDFGSYALGCGALSPQSAADAAARKQRRRQANAATGLENESEAQRQRARIGARVYGGGGGTLIPQPRPLSFAAAALVAGAAD